MKMEHIMNYKVYLYVFNILLSLFALNGIHFSKFMRTNRIWEARILIIILSFIMGYLLTNFMIDFTQSFRVF